MNIFATSDNPQKCAQVLDDSRVIKMILESAQLLSGAIRVLVRDGVIHNHIAKEACEKDLIYKLTHEHHPCSVWARSNRENYSWLLNHLYHLSHEYTVRRFKSTTHKSALLLPPLEFLGRFIPNNGPLTPFPCCVDGEVLTYLSNGDTHEAYKLHLIKKWDNDKREPRWFRAGGRDSECAIDSSSPTWYKQHILAKRKGE